MRSRVDPCQPDRSMARPAPSITRNSVAVGALMDGVLHLCNTPPNPDEGGSVVPMIEVKLYDRRVTEESVPKMIEALTNALAETSGAAPEHIQVVIQGVDPKHWGIAGKQQS